MDANRFDHLTRTIGEQTSRRTMMKVAAGGTLAALGLGAVGRVALGQDVSIEAKGFKGDKCDSNSDCKKGLTCKNKNKNNKNNKNNKKDGKCKYKSGCGGKKNQACKKNKDCCNGKNLKCRGGKCKRQN